MHAQTAKTRAAIPFITYDYLDKKREILNFTLDLEPQLKILESRNAFATAFPSGTIVISDSLVKSFSSDPDSFDSTFLAVLIHELVHVYDGHAIEQWVTADGRNDWVADKSLGTLAKIASIIPFLSVKNEVEYGTAFKSFESLPKLSEYSSDLAAVSLLKKNDLAHDDYIKFLRQVDGVIKASDLDAKEPFSWLEERIECLENFTAPQFEEDVKMIIIGSEKHDQVTQWLDLEHFRSLHDQLDSPEQLKNLYRGDDPPTDEDLEELKASLLGDLENMAFTACAVRKTFSEIKLEDGILITPGFDLTMFGSHY